jgi:cytochrome c oxidase assembly protein Cox11
MYAAIFGACYGMVPLYRVFCEHVGLEGDLN